MSLVLLVCGDDWRLSYAEELRAQRLLVHTVSRPEDTWEALTMVTPDVAVVAADCTGVEPDVIAFIEALRCGLDDATSIILISQQARFADREPLRRAGLDLLLLNAPQPSEVAYEVKRALILRRSGRRLPWNGPAPNVRAVSAATARDRAS